MKREALFLAVVSAVAAYLLLRKKTVQDGLALNENDIKTAFGGISKAQDKTIGAVDRLAETIGQIGNNINIGAGIDYDRLASVFGNDSVVSQLTRSEAYNAFVSAGCGVSYQGGNPSSVGQRTACEGLKRVIDSQP